MMWGINQRSLEPSLGCVPFSLDQGYPGPGERLPVSLHTCLKLPIIFYFDSTVEDSFFLTDSAALEALQLLGELSDLREMIGGRVWVGRAIVYAIIAKYPGAVQVMVG